MTHTHSFLKNFEFIVKDFQVFFGIFFAHTQRNKLKSTVADKILHFFQTIATKTLQIYIISTNPTSFLNLYIFFTT